MAQTLEESGCISPAGKVSAAFRAVPRHVFLDRLSPDQKEHEYDPSAPSDAQLDQIYDATAGILVRRGSDPSGLGSSSSSAPNVMGPMLEALNLRPGLRVLEIGTGSGYNAALLAHMVGPDEQVVSVEYLRDVAHAARKHLDRASISDVLVIYGDGGKGYPHGAPYDRLISTASITDIPPPWREQLCQQGSLVAPWAFGGVHHQALLTVQRDGDHLIGGLERPLAFMALGGALSSRQESMPTLSPEEDSALADVIKEPGVTYRLPLGKRLAGRTIDFSVVYGLLLLVHALEKDVWRVSHIFKPLPNSAKQEAGLIALWDKERQSLAVLFPVTVEVVSYGGKGMGERFFELLERWSAIGNPSIADYEVRISPRGKGELDGAFQIDGPWHTWTMKT